MLEQSSPKRPELKQRLGFGWLGVIHAAGTGPDGTPLAVRTLSPERLANVGSLAQLLSFAAQHEHKHVLPVTMPQTEGSEVYYLMPHAVGGSLRGVFDRYRAAGAQVDSATMLDVARQVAEALDEAHTHGVLHGNLKPENVLLQPLPAPQEDEYRLLVSDFGLNSLRTPDPHSPYLPAPQRAGAAPTLESDLYALGALIYEGVSGRALPPQPLQADLLDLPDPAAKVVSRCLGLSTPFADMTAFLGYLRAVQIASQAGLGSVQLSADHSYVDAVPGEPQEVRLKVHSATSQHVELQLEGLPSDWWPTLPALDLQPGVEALVTLKLHLPRKSSVQAKQYDAQIVALASVNPGSAAGIPPERMEVARLPLPIRVQPFESSLLRLNSLSNKVRSFATITANLRNQGNQTQRYNLEVNLPEGTQVRRGTTRKQLELAPGAEYSEILDVRLPTPGLSRRDLTITALANSASHPTATEHDSPADSWLPVYNTVKDHLSLEQSPLVPWWGLALAALGVLGLGAWAARPPQIQEFQLQGDPPMQGEPFTLVWKTGGARQVQIAELPGQTLDTSGQLHVPGLNTAKTYTLVASGLLSQKKQQVTVSPTRPAPRIETFKVTPPKAALGESVRVEWNVLNAAHVTLQPFGTVPTSGSRELVMQRDTRLTLNARKGAEASPEDVTSTLTVPLSAPQISTFTLTPANALRGQNVTVQWKVSGAKVVRMNPLGELPPSGTRTFPATQTGNYVLKASNSQQETTASASLTVRVPQARIEALTITPSDPQVGQPVRVQWRSQNATRAELRWANQRQAVAPSGDLTLTATPNMAVTLVAENPNGDPAMLTKRLQVSVPAPAQAPSNAAGSTAGSVPPTHTAPPPAPTASSTTGSRTPKPSSSTVPNATRPSSTASAAPGKSSSTSTQATTSNGSRPASSKATSTSAQTTAQVQVFAFRPPSTQSSGRPSLLWQVKGVNSVKISGMKGPNADGSFPASGSVRLPISAQTRTFTLTAGQTTATVRVPVTTSPPKTGSGAAGNSASPSRPAQPTTPAAPRFPEVIGTWNHSFGQLTIQESGGRITGNLLSSRADLPSGRLTGRLSGSGNDPTLNAFVEGEGERVALVVRFDLAAHTFNGLYASRSARVPWCGWKAPAANPCQ